MPLSPFYSRINYLYHRSKLALRSARPTTSDFYELKELLFLYWLTDAGKCSFSQPPRDAHVFDLLRIEGLVTDNSLTPRGIELAAALLRIYMKFRDAR